MAAVAEIYHRVIHKQHLPKREDQDSEFRLRATVAESGKEQSFKQILEHLAGDSPQLYEIAARRDLASHTRRNQAECQQRRGATRPAPLLNGCIGRAH